MASDIELTRAIYEKAEMLHLAIEAARADGLIVSGWIDRDEPFRIGFTVTRTLPAPEWWQNQTPVWFDDKGRPHELMP